MSRSVNYGTENPKNPGNTRIPGVQLMNVCFPYPKIPNYKVRQCDCANYCARQRHVFRHWMVIDPWGGFYVVPTWPDAIAEARKDVTKK